MLSVTVCVGICPPTKKKKNCKITGQQGKYRISVEGKTITDQLYL